MSILWPNSHYTTISRLHAIRMQRSLEVLAIQEHLPHLKLLRMSPCLCNIMKYKVMKYIYFSVKVPNKLPTLSIHVLYPLQSYPCINSYMDIFVLFFTKFIYCYFWFKKKIIMGEEMDTDVILESCYCH